MIIGITGKVAAGKDSIIKILKNFIKYDIILDVDKIGNYFFELNKDKIFLKFKVNNKEEIRKIVFSNKKKMKKLESILHPRMKRFIVEIVKRNKKDKNILINCALLHKFNFHKFCDKIILVDANKEIRIKRIVERNNINYNDAENIINFQEKYHFLNIKRIKKILKESEKNKKYKKYLVINNDKDYNYLYKNVENLCRSLIEIS